MTQSNKTGPVGPLFSTEAANYDSLIIKLIPGYRSMIETLVQSIPFEREAPLTAIDLGGGTGAVTNLFLRQFPNSQVTLLDFAPLMLEQAQKKLASQVGCRFILADFDSMAFDSKYQVIFSSLALHHLVTNHDKKRFYQKIFDALLPDGYFVNFDLVLPTSGRHTSFFEKQRKHFLNQTLSPEEAESRWHRSRNSEDFPAPLVDHLHWLTEVGFIEVDVLCKAFSFALYCGFRGE